MLSFYKTYITKNVFIFVHHFTCVYIEINFTLHRVRTNDRIIQYPKMACFRIYVWKFINKKKREVFDRPRRP